MHAARSRRITILITALGLGCTSVSGEEPPSTDAGSGVPEAPGGGGEEICPASPCSIEEQCGCPVGDACDLDPTGLPTGATRCRPAGPAGGTELTSCTTSEECATGYTCTGASRCRQFCEDDADCNADEHCIHPVQYVDPDGTTQDVPGVAVCTTACKPDSAGGCPEDRTCRLIRRNSQVEENFWYTDCRPATPGTAGQGESCAGDDDCQPGYDCSRSAFVCRRICILPRSGPPEGCPAETTCNAYSPPAVLGGVEYGYCD